ncbi:predicted protein [Naegleria gruberi]|uniref:Predicted protein n=1 Tax=Naegleria gruberi TaxID=5762 RepID=D2VP38_NAEGR|nr:uncharacterized protein NAEGRDRAFT_70720 [Naegleria gruberi]EFC41365.1 predicted protein [Naegleria gruberi]|eukprot:XP_002674109.1 predicted protein [Naegleria gruberi strain NEG-M]
MSEVAQTARSSLLDVIMARHNNLQDQKTHSRLLYVAKKHQEDTTNGSLTEQYHMALFHKTGRKEDDFYGILFEGQEYYVHFLEGTKDCTLDFLRVLHRAKKDDEFLKEFDYKILSVKILLYTDDSGSLSFPRWTCRDIPTGHPAETDDDDFTNGNPLSKEEEKAGLIWIFKIQEMVTQLVTLGKKVMGLGIRQMSLFLDSLNQDFPQIIPRESLLKEISNECEHCFQLSDFLEVFDKPITLDLSGENVW